MYIGIRRDSSVQPETPSEYPSVSIQLTLSQYPRKHPRKALFSMLAGDCSYGAADGGGRLCVPRFCEAPPAIKAAPWAQMNDNYLSVPRVYNFTATGSDGQLRSTLFEARADRNYQGYNLEKICKSVSLSPDKKLRLLSPQTRRRNGRSSRRRSARLQAMWKLHHLLSPQTRRRMGRPGPSSRSRTTRSSVRCCKTAARGCSSGHSI